jgi:hypothetical protein
LQESEILEAIRELALDLLAHCGSFKQNM